MVISYMGEVVVGVDGQCLVFGLFELCVKMVNDMIIVQVSIVEIVFNNLNEVDVYEVSIKVNNFLVQMEVFYQLILCFQKFSFVNYFL